MPAAARVKQAYVCAGRGVSAVTACPFWITRCSLSPAKRDGASGAPTCLAIKKLFHHRRGLPEQQLALLLGADRGLPVIRIDFLGERVGAHGGRALAGGLEPALEMRKIVDVLILVLVRHDPGIARHVGD